MAYERRNINTDYVAAVAGFIVARLRAHPGARTVIAECRVDNEVIASASAADNTAAGVISSSTQSFTVPVHANSTYRVHAGVGGSEEIEVRWIVP